MSSGRLGRIRHGEAGPGLAVRSERSPGAVRPQARLRRHGMLSRTRPSAPSYGSWGCAASGRQVPIDGGGYIDVNPAALRLRISTAIGKVGAALRIEHRLLLPRSRAPPHRPG